MNNKSFKYIYGPVMSWRLGSSLGVDPISAKEKICTFDCIYCQIGKTKVFEDERKIFVPVEDILKEIDSLPDLAIDYITFSGAGEPTLAANLGEMIQAVKKERRERIAVITNYSLIDRKDVQQDLLLADLVVAKLDADVADMFNKINQPMKTVHYTRIIQGLKEFKAGYSGTFALQVMFMKENKKHAQYIAEIANTIKPDEIQLNTPLRPCAVQPLGKEELDEIQQLFIQECRNTAHVFTVYDVQKRTIRPISDADTLQRRGKTY